MELSGEIELDGASTREVWRVFSDPDSIGEAIPGCKFIAPAREVEDVDVPASKTEADARSNATPGDGTTGTFEEGDEYVAVVRIGVGDIRPRFEMTIHVTEREFPRMSAHVDGAGGDTAFGMDTEIELVETPTGVTVDWHSTVDISGRLTQINSTILTTVSEKLTDRFFDRIERNVGQAPA